MKQQKRQITARDLLTSTEAQVAAETFVWVVWWEFPDKSWEAICLSEAEVEKEYETRQADNLIKSWGKVGKRCRQSLLEWFEGHFRIIHNNGHIQYFQPANAEEYGNTLKEALRRVSAGEPGPVIMCIY